MNKNKWYKSKLSNSLFTLPSLLIVIVFTIIPIIYVILDAFQYDNSFNKIFSDSQFWIAFWNTLLFTAIAPLTIIFISILIALSISTIVRSFWKNNLTYIMFIQYFFISVAISTAFISLFANSTGFINWIIELTGNDPVKWFGLKNNMARWTTLIYLVVSGIPFNTTVFTSMFLSTYRKNRKLFLESNMHMRSLQIEKSLLNQNIKAISLFFIYELIQTFFTYPVGLFGGDYANMFYYDSQTLMAYIYRAAQYGTYNIAAATSIIMMLMWSLTIPIYYIYKYWGYIKEKIWRVNQ